MTCVADKSTRNFCQKNVNVNKMSSHSYPDNYQLKFCPFPNTNSQYICFKYEKCCPEGCCYSYSFTYFQSWYFWLVVLLLFLIFYSASWYCKKLEIERKRRAQVVHTSEESGVFYLRNSPRRNDGRNVDGLLECLMQTYRARNINAVRKLTDKGAEPPPGYQEAIHMPKVERRNDVQEVQVHVDANGSTSANACVNGNPPPPTYDDATRSGC